MLSSRSRSRTPNRKSRHTRRLSSSNRSLRREQQRQQQPQDSDDVSRQNPSDDERLSGSHSPNRSFRRTIGDDGFYASTDAPGFQFPVDWGEAADVNTSDVEDTAFDPFPRPHNPFPDAGSDMDMENDSQEASKGFERFPPPSPKSNDKKKRLEEKKKKKKSQAKDANNVPEKWEDNLVDRVMDYISPDEGDSDSDSDSDDESVKKTEAESSNILSYFFPSDTKRDNQALLDIMQESMLGQMGCCRQCNFEDIAMISEDDDDTLDELNPDYLVRKRMGKERRSSREKTNRDTMGSQKPPRNYPKTSPSKPSSQVQLMIDELSVDENHKGIRALTCYGYGNCYDECADDTLYNDLVCADDNNSVANVTKSGLKKSKKKNGKGVKKSKSSGQPSNTTSRVASFMRFRRSSQPESKKQTTKAAADEQREIESQKAGNMNQQKSVQPENLYKNHHIPEPEDDASTEDSTKDSLTNESDSKGTASTTSSDSSRTSSSGSADSSLGSIKDLRSVGAGSTSSKHSSMLVSRPGEVDEYLEKINKFRQEHFPGMSHNEIIGKLDGFLEKRKVTGRAKQEMLTKMKLALVCQETGGASISGMKNDFSDDDDNKSQRSKKLSPGRFFTRQSSSRSVKSSDRSVASAGTQKSTSSVKKRFSGIASSMKPWSKKKEKPEKVKSKAKEEPRPAPNTKVMDANPYIAQSGKSVMVVKGVHHMDTTTKKNYREFCKKHFPGMNKEEILKEFNVFLKGRGLSNEAKEEILKKVKVALESS